MICMKTKVFNLIILDESGSMSYIERQALNGLNETLQTIRRADIEAILEELLDKAERELDPSV